jgi:hypothetical protein
VLLLLMLLLLDPQIEPSEQFSGWTMVGAINDWKCV